MPQATAITVKDPSNADVTYAVLSPSAGDGQPALFRVESSADRNLRPTLAIRSRGPNGGTRRVEGVCSFPIVRVVDGVNVKQGAIPVDFSIALPGHVSDSEAEYAVTVASNLIASDLVRAAMEEGYAPV